MNKSDMTLGEIVAYLKEVLGFGLTAEQLATPVKAGEDMTVLMVQFLACIRELRESDDEEFVDFMNWLARAACGLVKEHSQQ